MAAAVPADVAAELAKLTAEQVALAEKGPDGKPLPPSSIDSFQRAVLRRYEPMQQSQVTSMLTCAGRQDRGHDQQSLGTERAGRWRQADPARPEGRQGSGQDGRGQAGSA
jgi:hypothetical protein